MFDYHQVRRDLTYLLPGLALALASFAVLACALLLGIGTVVIWVGVPLLVGTLTVARGFAELERRRLAHTGATLPAGHYAVGSGRPVQRMRAVLTDGQRWRDLVFGIVALPVALFTWSVTVWWTLWAVLGSLYPLYGWYLLDKVGGDRVGGVSIANALSLHGSSAKVVTIAGQTVLGLLFLASAPRVLHGLVGLHILLAKALLTNEKAALRERAEQLTASRSAVVQAEAQTLRRVERDIHDGPQQRLVRLTMDLEAVRRRMDDNPEAARTLVDEALEQSHAALNELRTVSRGIAPPVLTDRGLTAALAAAAARSPIPTTIDSTLGESDRLPEAVENAAYFTASEALTNVAKHAAASVCTVTVTRDRATLWVRITDNGVGGAHLGKGHGLSGLADRLAGVDGRLDVHSPVGGPTVITAEIPLRG
ncbi:sensor histidine kinase [Nocardia panacis]|nr:sensor histidine kinase [Nocardia panacis]